MVVVPPILFPRFPHRSPPYHMVTPGTRAVGDAPQNVDYLSATLNADIQHFATFKDTGEVSPVKAVFASVVAILTLVRV